MTADRRGAPRHPVPDDLIAHIGGAVVRVLELSLVGAKIEHRDRFALSSPELTMTWRGDTAGMSVRTARSEIVGRHGAQLVYHTGLFFVGLNSIARGFISSVLNATKTGLGTTGTPIRSEPAAAAEAPERTFIEDTWTRRVQLLKQELDEDFPFAQFRLTATGWQKEYVTSPEQPEDGFTISRDRHDFDELQRAFEAADPETRRMMQIALTSQLAAVR